MVTKKITLSQLRIISSQHLSREGRKAPQYAAALSASLGALAFGTVMGWTAAAGNAGIDLAVEYEIPISIGEYSWIGSVTNLGCAVVCIPIGILTDALGRKVSMLMLIVPYLIGWGLIIFSKSVIMFVVGRFLLGLSGGAFCVVIPIYTAEIGETAIRGRLGSYLELMMSTGILFSYTISSFTTIYRLSIILSIIPLIFFSVFSFMPETPVYYLMKNKEDQARASLLRLRGPEYNIDEELQTQKDALLEEAKNRGSFLEAMKSKSSQNGLIVAYGLMFFQQLSGITAIVFYTTTIFARGGSVSQEASMIIAGSLQVFSTSISMLVVDKLGRKLLLISSIAAMTIGTLTLGTYFYMLRTEVDVSTFSWLPLVSVGLFLVMCSFGFGPIPWMMVGELFSPQIKGVAGSSACCFNWMMAFLVARWYNELAIAFGIHTTFWIFSAISGLGILFVVFIVPETKGKSLEQIQVELGGSSRFCNSL